MADDSSPPGSPDNRRIFINAFDMFTPSHLSFGQWKRPEDQSRNKRRDLSYWTNLAKLLERGGVTALFLADTYGLHDIYKGGRETAVRTATQYPMGDPAAVSTAHPYGCMLLGYCSFAGWRHDG